jgi:hypothetical protein
LRRWGKARICIRRTEGNIQPRIVLCVLTLARKGYQRFSRFAANRGPDSRFPAESGGFPGSRFRPNRESRFPPRVSRLKSGLGVSEGKLGVWGSRVSGCQRAAPAGHSTPRNMGSAHGEPNPGSESEPPTDSESDAGDRVFHFRVALPAWTRRSDLSGRSRFRLLGPRRADSEI